MPSLLVRVLSYPVERIALDFHRPYTQERTHDAGTDVSPTFNTWHIRPIPLLYVRGASKRFGGDDCAKDVRRQHFHPLTDSNSRHRVGQTVACTKGTTINSSAVRDHLLEEDVDAAVAGPYCL